MSATSGGGGSVSEGSEAGESSQSTMSVGDSPSTSIQTKHAENVTKITLSEEGLGDDIAGSKINLTLDERQENDGIVNMAFDYEEGGIRGSSSGGIVSGSGGAIMSGSGGAIMSGGSGAIMSGGSGGIINGSSSGMISGGSSGMISGGSSGIVGSEGGNMVISGGGSMMGSSGGRMSAGGGGGISGSGSGNMIGSGGSSISGGSSGGGVVIAAGAGSGAGDLKSINGSDKKDKVPEAVNLELVNMVPYSNGNGTSYGVPVNGIPMKKDSEQVDMSTPYDEYFVPVNEHKKYMRGEKLYVTKDKRRPTSWRRCLSWIVACTVITVVLIVAILAGTGVILSQEPNLVKEASVGRNFAGSNLKPSVTQKSSVSPKDMTHMYVPRSIESELIIDNLDFDPALENVNSSAYQQLAQTMENQLRMILFEPETLEFASSDIGLRVVNISRDPFKVNYRIGWNYKQGVQNPPEPIKMEDVKRRLVESLARNQGYIDKYHIDSEAIKVDHVTNNCQIDNGGCSHICYYNYKTQEFTCTCPTHLVLDESRKNCVVWDDAAPVPSHTVYPGVPYEPTASPAREREFDQHFHHGSEHGVHGHLEHEYDSGASPEPTPEPGSEDDFDEGHHKHDVHAPEPAAEPVPEPTAEPAPEPTAEPALEPNLHHKYGSHDLESQPEPTPEPTADDKSGSHDHFYKQSESEPSPEPTPEPGTDVKDHETSPEPTADSDSESKQHHLTLEHGLHTYGSKDEEPSPEPTAEPDSTSKHNQGSLEHGLYAHESKDEEPAPEPTPEPDSNQSHDTREHDLEYVHKSRDEEPSPEPTPEPDSKPSHETQEHGVGVEYESKDEEPSPEPTAQPDSVSKQHHHTLEHGLQTHESKDEEPAPEPTAEPDSTFKHNQDTLEHGLYGNESQDEEPAPEPTAVPDSNQSHDVGEHDSGHMHQSKDHEPRAETNPTLKEGEHEPQPTPEPSAEPDTKDSFDDSEMRIYPVGGVHEHTDTTVQPNMSAEHQHLDSNSSHDSHNQQQEAGMNESIPSHAENADSPTTMKYEPNRETQSTTETTGHHVPYLEDILIRDSGLSAFNGEHSTENTTAAKGPLGNVEVTKDGEPVVEEIIINKSKPTLQQESDSADGTKREEVSEEILTEKPGYILGLSDHPGSVIGPRLVNSTDESVPLREPVVEEVIINKSKPTLQQESDSADGTKKEEVSEEISTGKPGYILGLSDHPGSVIGPRLVNSTNESIPLGAHMQTAPESAEGTTTHPKTIESSSDQVFSSGVMTHGGHLENVSEKTIERGQEPSSSEHPLGDVNMQPIHSEQRPDTASAATTRQPESFTIPVSVLEDTGANHMEPAREENRSRTQNTETSSPVMSFHEQSQNGEGHTVNGIGQASVETTPASVVADSENKSEVSGDTQKTGDEPNNATENIHPESNETKSPEEFSNNIKDEVLDNEEFNTLLDTNEEGHSNDSKEILLNKYPNKPGKGDKKKIKDYVKGDKTDADKKLIDGAVIKPTKEFISQKHANENAAFYPEYNLQNEHSVKQEGEDAKVIGPQETDGIPGVSLKPHGIDNHDISVLQTVAPDFRTETVSSSSSSSSSSSGGDTPDVEMYKPETKTKPIEGDSKLEKEYPKFDKDYKYDKQKGSKKKDLKKKIGGKDGKNVELEDGRKIYTELGDKDLDVTQEVDYVPQTTMNPSFEKINVQSEIGTSGEEGRTEMPQTHDGMPTTIQPLIQIGEGSGPESNTNEGSNVHTAQPDLATIVFGGATGKPEMKHEGNDNIVPVDQRGHLMIDEPSVKSRVDGTPGTVYDGQMPGMVNFTDADGRHSTQFVGGQVTGHVPGMVNFTDPEGRHSTQFVGGQVTGHVPGMVNFTDPEGRHSTQFVGGQVTGHMPVMVNFTDADGRHTTQFVNGQATGSRVEIPGTVFDGMTHDTTNPSHAEGGAGFSFDTTQPLSNSSTVFVTNSTTAHPTIVVHGQSGKLQDGHTIRLGNSTFFSFGNGTTASPGTITSSDGHSFTFTNFTTTFPNGSTVHPTIIIRGQSGALQDGHEVRFGNSTFHAFVTPSGVFDGNQTTGEGAHQIFFGNSTVYRIENGSFPGTVFDGNYNPEDGHYHTFTNSSGTYVYRNYSNSLPTFTIKGVSGEFGNATGYILGNSSSTVTSQWAPSVIFRNSTVFAVGNSTFPTVEFQGVTLQPGETTGNESIRFTHQINPATLLSGTAYKVNNYFGYVSKCAAGQFQCVNGTSKRGSACINLSSKCDSINDCSDGSDELGCIENGCPGNFQCSDGTCLKRNLVCNGIVDCSDGSDEKQCENWKCEFDEFQCPSGRCIPVVWQCDNKPDCDNHTDEYNCQTSCGNDEYLCPEGWCIPLTYKCNGIKECSNGEDEQLCDCSHEEFKCQTGGCISKTQVCNGLDDCPDRSDEWGCVEIEPETSLLKIRTAAGNFEPVCADNWSAKHSDELCASLGYYSSVPLENGNESSLTTETSFFVLRNDTTAGFNKKFLANLIRSSGKCDSGKLVEVSCQEFSCGSRSMTDSSSVEPRFIGGMGATAGQWPSVAMLYNIRNFHSCTANVLTPRWVLASYNCLKSGNKNLNEQDWKLFGGSTVFEVEKENAETRKVVSIVPHPQVKFNQFLFSNDLALVELDEPLQFTSNVGAVCLPEQEIQPRQICVTAGWGLNTPEDKSMKQQLQYLPVPTMNLTECNSTEHYSGFITDDKICAGFNTANKSLCYNEEGAPLMCVNDRGEWELQGVLSYHSNCGRGSHPSIFSSITPVRDWIKKTIGNSFERKVIAATKR